MRSVEEIQNLVFSAFETMIRDPEIYMPCSVIEFEARLSSYLWMLAISEEREQDWAQTQEQLRVQRDWSAPLDIVSSVQSETGSADDQKSIQGVIDFYAEFAHAMGFVSGELEAEDHDQP